MIRVEHLHKSFSMPRSWRSRDTRAVVAVDDVSFHARNGQITGLLGPNGAGKTTTLRMVAGLMTPERGEIRVDEVDARREPRRALARLGVLSDARGLYPRLSARENIVYYAVLQGMAREQAHERVDALAQALDMRGLLERRTDGFSQGERMKTALARALVHDPANLILDEPTNGLDVLSTRALRETLLHLCSPQGGAKCIVMSSHVMQEVEKLCDEVVIVSHGRTVAHGTVAQLCERGGEPDFEEAFVKLAFAQELAAQGAAA